MYHLSRFMIVVGFAIPANITILSQPVTFSREDLQEDFLEAGPFSWKRPFSRLSAHQNETTMYPINPSFFVRGDLKMVFITSVILIILMAGVSIAGMVYPQEIYPDANTSLAFVPTDLLNLVLGIPAIILCMYLTVRHKLIGLLCYPGPLFYITYIYTTYLLGIPPGVLFIPYLVLVGLSIVTLIMVFRRMDGRQIGTGIKGFVPLRSAGTIIFILGSLIAIYQVWSIIRSVIQDVPVDRITIAQWIVDLVVGSPALLLTGLSMVRRKDFGCLAGTGALLLLSMLFIGLIPVMIMEGSMSGDPVNLPDMLIISASSLICLVPFILFVRGAIKVH